MKIRVITPEGRVRFLEEAVTRNVQFMKKYGLKVQHLETVKEELPEGNIIPDEPIEEELPLLSDGFIPESIIQKKPAKGKPGPKSRKK